MADDWIYSTQPARVATPEPAPASAPAQGGDWTYSAPKGQKQSSAPVQQQSVQKGLRPDEELKFWDEAPSDINQPRRLSKEDEDAYFEFQQLNMGNPNFSQEDIERFWRDRGGNYKPEQATKRYLDAVRKGGDVTNAFDYSKLDEEDAKKRQALADQFGKTVDPNQSLFSREYQEAIQYGFPGLIARWGNDWLDTGKDELRKRYPGQSEDWYEQTADKIVREGQRAIRDYYAQESERDPTWKPDENAFSNIVSGRWIPSIGAAVLGSPGPESFIVPGSSVLGRIGGQAGVSGLAQLGYELVDKSEGVSDQVSVANILAAAGLGGLFRAGFEGGSALLKVLRDSGDAHYVKQVNELLQRGATREEFDALARKSGHKPFGPELDEVLNRPPVEGEPGLPGPLGMEGEAGIPGPRFTPKPEAAPKITADAVVEKVNNITKDWTNSPEIEVVNSVDEIADPVIRGRMAYLKEKGLSGFDELSLPSAVIALKQGVGRLIRDNADKGVLMIADPRLTGREYGGRILASLPQLPKTRDEQKVLQFIRELELTYEAVSD